MIRDRLAVYRDRVRRELTTAFAEDHSPHEVAVSFAIGLFVTSMPTGGLGLGLLAAMAYWQSWTSKTAMFGAVVCMNPFVKPAVYVASYQLGSMLLGSEQLVFVGHGTIDTAFALVQFLLVGNFLIALALSGLSYLIVLHLTRSYRRREDPSVGSSPVSVALSLFNRRK
ncbi:hypothetical protein JCM18750_07710 [Halostagnicola bangensis]